ncbi:MAG TPA: hypothetical protein VMS74_09390 [Acidimicrobiia bacterium]|nr:hypothetical protein [Acidimicrobiia bacterium]
MISRIVALLAALVLATACTPAADTTTTTLTTTVPSEPVTSAPTSTAESTTTTTAPVATTLPVGTESLPIEMRQEIAELIVLTEHIRGLTFLQPPTIIVVSAEELEQRVRDSIEEEIETLPADEALLELLGLIDAETDLLGLYLDLYGEQVAGSYDGETGELVIPAGEMLSALQKGTLVHELTHALTDQRFGFMDRYGALLDGDLFDEAVALLAVAEGDAMLTEVQYIQQLSFGEQQEFLAEAIGRDSPVFDAAPAYLQNSLLFPYQEGLAFVQRAYEIGGHDEVNRLYVEPPVSSEQIINPRAYGEDMPIPVEIVEPAVAGYDVVYESVWGQLSFQLMFDQVLGGASDAVDGWGGDSYIQWFDGENAAFLLAYAGDAAADHQEMADALTRYAQTAMDVEQTEDTGAGAVFEGEDFAFVRVTGDRVFFVAASDPAVGRRIVAALP